MPYWLRATTQSSSKAIITFPPDSIKQQHFQKSSTHTTCPWKGEASYYDVVVDGNVNKDAAWYYPDPKPAAAEIKDRVAFWRGVKVKNKVRQTSVCRSPALLLNVLSQKTPWALDKVRFESRRQTEVCRTFSEHSLPTVRITQHYVLSRLRFRRTSDEPVLPRLRH